MRDKTSARERLLAAAAELFYADGMAATGIDAITARAGVAKMSLYNNFASKAELIQAYIEARRADWRVILAARLKMASTPQERVLAVFDSYADYASDALASGFRGCGLLNAAAELPVGDPGRDAVRAQKEDAERMFLTYLAEMQPRPADPADLARHLSFLLEGAMARAGLDGHKAALCAARAIAVSLLDGVERRSA